MPAAQVHAARATGCRSRTTAWTRCTPSFLHAISSGYQFTEAFGALAELDWEETPFGMIYIATRRIGDLVWVRVCDFMAPNVHQFTREIEEASGGEDRRAGR